MNYQDTLNYLYNSMPMFQQVGSKAYKEGLENTFALDKYFNHPHKKYKTIHVAGTNGKGTCSHTLAAILQSAGYKVGLYTSPHLIDFGERIRVNGRPISQQYVVEFVEKHRSFFEPLYPSFFELTTAMAFLYFTEQEVDVAVIEVGLGGRLDCTNIIQPDLSIITNISYDHTALLGHTLNQIAVEKAGIIKPHTPVVIGEATEDTKPVFLAQAKKHHAHIVFAEEEQRLLEADRSESGEWIYQTKEYGNLKGELSGFYQIKNTNTLLSAIYQLQLLNYRIEEKDVREGFLKVGELTGLMGRWQKLQSSPTLICDTGHNTGGMSYIVEQLEQQIYKQLHFVIGMVDDKDIDGVLSILPKDAIYYFTKATVKRALPEKVLMEKAATFGLKGATYPDVVSAVKAAQEKSLPEDFIFVGGSSFIVADLLSNRDTLNLH
ncbi:folylpolyglutamate synthase/dihydrofolate synthase family protein [Bacteroides sp. 224]|uniref:bifunctional folylpolyglutamate synthase/dihydrofolate synthase n=1 Tax=Bacteroides sp. 224 TaxID=2302936 RepID=UPI0013CFB44A|nr:folylpolyglutamate synthase/dihydrofolate synthase family protein [Bacteroides sp. 224]NDV65782.1 bifunctional folylpolyglutamate synthase/dihydrofolate synthase [Bacteroides sp. 224]